MAPITPATNDEVSQWIGDDFANWIVANAEKVSVHAFI